MAEANPQHEPPVRGAANSASERSLQLYRLAIRDAAVPAALALAIYYAAIVPFHWTMLTGSVRTAVIALALATCATFFALAWRWSRRPTTADAFITWLACVVTVNNMHVMWRIGSPHEAVGFYLTQAGLGFAGLTFKRYWQLTAMLFAGFVIGPIRAAFSPLWLAPSMIMGAALALSFLMQTASSRYRARLEQANRESDLQREAAERNLAWMQKEVAERERLQERLARAERLESLGLLAGGVAHDFNNLLAVVAGNASLALERTQDRETHADLEAILDASDRATLLAKELLAYAGRGVTNLVPLDLAREAVGVCKLAQSSLPPRVSLRTDRCAESIVRGDRGQLQQVALNLIMNAADATAARGGTIEISTGCESLDEETAARLEPAHARSAGGYAFLRVSDTGVGMTPETIRHVFDPFFTTKRSGRGLGLAAALGIARAHGGGFRVASEPDVGSEFTLFLPRSEDAPLELGKPLAPSDRRGVATILVVDDQFAVRRMLARALESGGFRAIEAAGGVEAEAFLRAAGTEVAAAVVDMSMPDVDGEETLQRLRALRPDLPVLLSSGFDVHEAARRLALLPGVGFLAKPYRVAEVKSRLLELIDGTPQRESEP